MIIKLVRERAGIRGIFAATAGHECGLELAIELFTRDYEGASP